MSTFFLINTVVVSGTKVFAGDTINDAVDDAVAIAAAGGLLWPSSDPVVAAAAARAVNARLNRGANEEAVDAIMQAAVDAVQLAEDASSGPDVANIAALSALNDVAELNGAIRRVVTLLQSFMLDRASTATIDGITVVATLSGVGRWHRILSHVPQWTNQSAWERNFATGNDENPGTVLLPLKTCAEFTRRVRVAKYSSSFTPYVLHIQDDVDVANDSFQWNPSLFSTTGTLSSALDTGIGTTLLTITGNKTVVDTGSLTGAVVSLTGNAKSTITRAAGVFAVGDIVEFTSGPSIGTRVYITSAGATGGINPWNLNSTTPAPGDTFNVVTLTRFGPQLSGYMSISGARVEVSQCEFPGATFGTGDYEIQGYVLRLLNCLSRISIGAGIGARVRYSSGVTTPCAIIRTSLSFFAVERGFVALQFFTSVNVVWDLFTDPGRLTVSRSEIQNGCFRQGGIGSVPSQDAGCFLRVDRARVFDVPTTVAGNPLEGGTGDVGAALIMKRGAIALVRNLVGSSVNAGTSGVDISGGARVYNQGTPASTVGGALQELVMDAGAIIPSIDPVTGLPVTGAATSPITTWAMLAAAPYSGNAMNLVNGTKFVAAP
jgi:hypothetical protein